MKLLNIKRNHFVGLLVEAWKSSVFNKQLNDQFDSVFKTARGSTTSIGRY